MGACFASNFGDTWVACMLVVVPLIFLMNFSTVFFIFQFWLDMFCLFESFGNFASLSSSLASHAFMYLPSTGLLAISLKLKLYFFSQIRTHFVALRSELLLHFAYEKFFSFCLTSLVLTFFPSKFTVLSFLSLALSRLCAQLTTSTHLIRQQPSLRAVIPIMGICFGKCSKAGHYSQELNNDSLTTPI